MCSARNLGWNAHQEAEEEQELSKVITVHDRGESCPWRSWDDVGDSTIPTSNRHTWVCELWTRIVRFTHESSLSRDANGDRGRGVDVSRRRAQAWSDHDRSGDS